MKILTVIGARPQFIKAASVSRVFTNTTGVDEVLVHTGQHFDSNMSEIFFGQLQIPSPTHYLGIHGGAHGEMTGRMLIEIEKILLIERPDGVLVYGDTNSTLASALAAAKLDIPVIHVEAGLRSFNRTMPEEINRILTDHAASLLLSPTDQATANLQHEGVNPTTIVQVGDVMYDSTLVFREFMPELAEVGKIQGLSLNEEYILATVHRQDNTDDPARLEAILRGLGAVAHQINVVLPLHPRTRQRIVHFGLTDLLAPLQTCEPLGFLDMMRLQVSCAAIVTDSGGIQKEAFFHRKACVTLRDETEWVELVESGWNRISPPLSSNICASVLEALGSEGADVTPYGNGDAAERVVLETMRFLSAYANGAKA